jgi:NADH:ubiquinone oxidoreductase subunit B-like Fe-S oxidoreductase
VRRAPLALDVVATLALFAESEVCMVAGLAVVGLTRQTGFVDSVHERVLAQLATERRVYIVVVLAVDALGLCVLTLETLVSLAHETARVGHKLESASARVAHVLVVEGKARQT